MEPVYNYYMLSFGMPFNAINVWGNREIMVTLIEVKKIIHNISPKIFSSI